MPSMREEQNGEGRSERGIQRRSGEAEKARRKIGKKKKAKTFLTKMKSKQKVVQVRARCLSFSKEKIAAASGSLSSSFILSSPSSLPPSLPPSFSSLSPSFSGIPLRYWINHPTMNVFDLRRWWFLSRFLLIVQSLKSVRVYIFMYIKVFQIDAPFFFFFFTPIEWLRALEGFTNIKLLHFLRFMKKKSFFF